MGRSLPPDGGLARAAYEAYGDAVGWRNYIGIPMPPWDQLTETVQKGWRAAVTAVSADRYMGSGTGPVETRADSGT